MGYLSRLRIWLLTLALLGGINAAIATSVVAPSFPELVSEAQVIVRAQVKSVIPAWVDSPRGKVIKTFVTLTVENRLKGEATEEIILQFLGGEIDGQGMRVEGMPQFIVGQREILFVSGNGVKFCPLVAMMHGRYRVLVDSTTAREYVARNDHVPLRSESDVQLPQGESALAARSVSTATALTPREFEQKISAEISRHASR